MNKLPHNFSVVIITLMILHILFFPITAEAAETGKIEIHPSPGYVKTYVDGEFTGETTTSTKYIYGIPAGSHTLTISKSGYKDWSKSIMVEVDQYTEVYAYLEEGSGDGFTRAETISSSTPMGIIEIYPSPGDVKTYVDGEFTGETTTSTKYIYGIPAGSHTLTISKSGYKDWSKSIMVEVDQYTEVYAYLEEGSGDGFTRAETTTQMEKLGFTRIDIQKSSETAPEINIEVIKNQSNPNAIFLSGTASSDSGIESVTVNGQYVGTENWNAPIEVSGDGNIVIIATGNDGNTTIQNIGSKSPSSESGFWNPNVGVIIAAIIGAMGIYLVTKKANK